MRLLKRFRPSPAMVVGCLALLLALGGTGYAASQALPRNSVTSVQVKDRSLLARDFKAGQLPRGPAGPAAPPVQRSRRPSRPRRRRRLGDDQVGARPPRRRHRRAVGRDHARSKAERRDVPPDLRQRGGRQADHRQRRATRRTHRISGARQPPARAAAGLKAGRARPPTTRARSSCRRAATRALRRITRSTSQYSANRGIVSLGKPRVSPESRPHASATMVACVSRPRRTTRYAQ